MEKAEQDYREAAEDCADLSGPTARDGGSGKGTPSDRTARAAERLAELSARVDRARAWDEVFSRTVREHYPPGTPEHKVMCLHYQTGWKLAAIARAERVDRQTIVRRDEAFVHMAAFLAAEAGLTREEVSGE